MPREGSSPLLEHQYAELNGVRLHYVTAGQGKLILFAHGFPEFWYAWKDQLAEFGRDHQAVALDLRGYNLSSKPTEVEQYGWKLVVEDLRTLAEHLGHRKFVLVGHDWGGAIAWGFALIHPDWLDKLVIVNAPHPAVFDRELRENPAQQRASHYMLVFRNPHAEQLLSAANYAALSDAVLAEGLSQGYFTEADRKAYLEAWSQPGALTGGLNYYRAAQAGPPGKGSGEGAAGFVSPALSPIVETPTLVIWGEKDQYLLTGNLEGLDPLVPNLTLKRIPEGSHWVIHEKPALVNATIRDFITQGCRRTKTA